MKLAPRLFDISNLLLLAVVGLAVAYPFIYTVSISLSSPAEASRTALHLRPGGCNLEASRRILQTP